MITIIMPTYKRNNFISDPDHPTLNLVKHNLVDKILLLWNNVGEEIPEKVLKNLQKKCGNKLEIILSKKNSLNNKYIDYEQIETECVLTVDDDYRSTVESMECMYKAWSEIDKNTLVGCVPRLMIGNLYTGDAAHLKSEIPYNFLLPGYLMFHKKYLKLYWENNDAVSIVEKNLNSDDMYFNFMHYKHCKAKRIYIHHDQKVKTWKSDPNCIAARPNHRSQKYEMINFLIKQGYDLPSYINHRIDMTDSGEVVK